MLAHIIDRAAQAISQWGVEAVLTAAVVVQLAEPSLERPRWVHAGHPEHARHEVHVLRAARAPQTHGVVRGYTDPVLHVMPAMPSIPDAPSVPVIARTPLEARELHAEVARMVARAQSDAARARAHARDAASRGRTASFRSAL